MTLVGMILILIGIWALCLPAWLRCWWTNEGGAVLCVTGAMLLLTPALLEISR